MRNHTAKEKQCNAPFHTNFRNLRKHMCIGQLTTQAITEHVTLDTNKIN